MSPGIRPRGGGSLTIDPGHTQGLKDGHKQEAHATGSVVVKELKYVHTALPGERTDQNCIRRKQTDLPTLASSLTPTGTEQTW